MATSALPLDVLFLAREDLPATKIGPLKELVQKSWHFNLVSARNIGSCVSPGNASNTFSAFLPSRNTDLKTDREINKG